MKISTKGRYSLRLMLDLALEYRRGSISLKDIAARQNVSLKYLEQLIAPLCRAGYVVSKRGAAGGYSLAREPETYTVGDIIRLTEGDLAPAPCLAAGPGCPDMRSCVYTEIFADVQKAVFDVLDGVTLKDMADKFREKNGEIANIKE